MIKFIKKHFNKFFIGILTLISAVSIGIGISSNYNKSYAYTSNEISYTIDFYSDSNFTNQINTQTVGDYNGILIDSSNITNNNEFLYFKMKGNTTYTKQYYFLFNWGYWNGTDWDWSLSAKLVYLNIYNNNMTIQQSGYSLGSISNNGNYLTYPYFNTFIGRNINTDDVNNYVYGSFYLANAHSSYSLFIKNIDVVPVQDITISQYYDTYYGQIEDNYNTLLSDYNDLQDNYNTLDNNYNDLQSNYDTLEDSYNTLQTDYTNYNNSLNYGIFTYLDYGVFTNLSTNESIVFDENASTDELSLESLIDKGVIMNSGIFNAYYFESNYNPNYDNISFKFYFKTNLFATNLIDFTLYGFNGARIVFTDNNGVNYPFTSRDISDDNIWTLGFKEFSAYGYSSIGEYIEELEIVPNNAEQFGRLYTSSNYYQGYVKGSRDTAQYYNGRMNDLQVEFSAEIRDLNSTITSMQLTINSLNEQISSFSSDYGINNMLWTIASTPFESFKNIWNVDFFGVNISNLITGFLTGLIVIWVIKKIFL